MAQNSHQLVGFGTRIIPNAVTFVDVEGTKAVKRMINLLAITVNLYHEIDADPSGSGSKTDRVRK